mgnify:CR=1 FL=1
MRVRLRETARGGPSRAPDGGAAASFVMIILWPILVLPLFYRVTPIDDQELLANRRALQAQMASADAQLRNAGMQYNREVFAPRSRTPPGGMAIPNLFDQMFTRPMEDFIGERILWVPSISGEHSLIDGLRASRLLFAPNSWNDIRKALLAESRARWPLTVLSGYIENLQHGGDRCAEVWQRPLQQMEQQTVRMQHIVEDLLLLARLESAQPGQRSEAFVDVGGRDGLIHVSELSWKHVDHPGSVVSVGDPVKVQVLDVDFSRPRNGGRPRPFGREQQCHSRDR